MKLWLSKLGYEVPAGLKTPAETAPAGAGESTVGPTLGGLLGLSGIMRAGGRR